MTSQEVIEILSGERILIMYDDNDNPVRFKTVFHADVLLYKYTALMIPEDTETYGKELISVNFLTDVSRGFLDEMSFYPVLETDFHTHIQLIDLYYRWDKATESGTTTYSKILTQKEYDMLFDPNSKKELTVYTCLPNGTFDTIDFNNIQFTVLDNQIYFIAFNENKDVLPFVVCTDSDDENIYYIQETSIDVGNTIAEKLIRTHIVGGKENFKILGNEDKHYHMRLYKDGELVEYKRLYSFTYDDKNYVYFDDVKTDLMWCFEVENVLGQWRVCRIDDSSKIDEIFWNHPFHWRITNEHNLFHADECTLTRYIGDEKETVYVLGNVVHNGFHYFALATKEEKDKKNGDIEVKIYCLLRPRGEPWLYPVDDEEEMQTIIDKLNSQ